MWEYEEVSSPMAKELASKFGISFHQTSARNGTGIDVKLYKIGYVL